MSSLLIKKANIYTPDHIGLGDILVINGIIAAIEKDLAVPGFLPGIKIIDAQENIAIPGIIDGHVHITGGGGEAGFKTQVPPLQVSTIIKNGVTTVGGLLGTDNTTRNLASVYAKACSLEEEGISSFIFSGGYDLPSPTLTDSIHDDIVFIEKVRGGKVAIADHRAAPISLEALARIATEVRLGGMMRNISTTLILHVGSSSESLSLPLALAVKYPHLGKILLPTHINRNQEILDEAIKIVDQGGFLDISSGLNTENLGPETIKPSRAIHCAFEHTKNHENILMSSDANGSALKYNENGELMGLTASSMESIHTEIRDAVFDEGLSLDKALTTVTKNPAKAYGLTKKGTLLPGKHGDIVILDKQLTPITTIARGKICMQDLTVLVQSTFE